MIEQQIETQAETITRYQRDNDRLTKRCDDLERMNQDAQEYIGKIKLERDELRAQLTPEARAEWIFQNGKD